MATLQDVLITAARDAAADWVDGWAAQADTFVGAFITGSTLGADPAAALPPASDVDVMVVVDGPAPGRLGTVEHSGVPLDVDFFSWDALADPGRVARTFYLAPSFLGDGVLRDPSGRLAAVQQHVTRVYPETSVIWSRCEDVGARLAARLEGFADGASWPQRVEAALFALSLPTQTVLVAAGQTPTVRLRYVRSRDVLARADRLPMHDEMLALLGCRFAGRTSVQHHLDAMAAAYDAVAALPPEDRPFAAELTAGRRASALEAIADLVDIGLHREAVFWLLVQFARCQQALDAAAHPAVAATHRDAFERAARSLVHLGSDEDLNHRREELRRFVPRLHTLARELIARR